MKQFIDLIEKIGSRGHEKTDRTGVGTISIFGHQTEFDLSDGFPLLTLKDTHFPSVVHELLWFLNSVPEKYKKFGNTNIKYLVDNKIGIWNEWALKPYLQANGKGDIKADPADPLWKEEMKNFVQKIREDDEFALKWGDLGTVYGKQWREWPSIEKKDDDTACCAPFSFEERSIDQIKIVLNQLQKKPDDRGIIVSAWNVAELDKMALRPCHTLFQFNTHNSTDTEKLSVAKARYIQYVKDTILDLDEQKKELARAEKMFRHWWESGTHPSYSNTFTKLPIFNDLPVLTLDLQLYQRSADVFLGVPFNIASYALLLHMMAQVLNMVPGRFIHTFGDAHLYKNHADQVTELLTRVGCGCGGTEKNYGPELPRLELTSSIKNLEDFRFEDIKLIGYNPLAKIKAPIAI